LLSKYVYFQKISGVTTWVQFGIPAAALSALMFRIAENRKKYVVQMIALCSLSVFRTLFMAEREASIETLLAVILMLLIIRNSPQKSENIKFWQVFAVFWPGVLVVFGTFEFLRSWSSYYSGISNDFFGFLVSRLLGYYATSLNNAALANSAMSWQDNLGTLFHINLFSNNEQIAETLSTNANLEFNNVSGLLLPFGALGFFGAIALLFVVARLFLLLFTSGSKGDLSSVLAYSCSAVSILEISRFFYLGDGRYLPVLIVLVYFRYKYKRVALDQRS
jgi:predicted membrane channel-forming protein YqfA (hemolysin III family)